MKSADGNKYPTEDPKPTSTLASAVERLQYEAFLSSHAYDYNNALTAAVRAGNDSWVERLLASDVKPTSKDLNASAEIDFNRGLNIIRRITMLLISAGAKVDPDDCEPITAYVRKIARSEYYSESEDEHVKAYLWAGFKTNVNHLDEMLARLSENIKWAIKSEVQLSILTTFLSAYDQLGNIEPFFLKQVIIKARQERDNIKNENINDIYISRDAFKLFDELDEAAGSSVIKTNQDLKIEVHQKRLAVAEQIVQLLQKAAAQYCPSAVAAPMEPIVLANENNDLLWEKIKKAVNQSDLETIYTLKMAGLFGNNKPSCLTELEEEALLLVALRNNKPFVLDSLFSAGLKPTARLLNEAASFDDKAFFNQILSVGATVAAYDVDVIEKAFFNALEKNSIGGINVLIKSGVTPSYTALFEKDIIAYSDKHCRYEIRKHLWEHGFLKRENAIGETHQALDAFAQRVRHAQQTVIGPKLAQLISEEERNALLRLLTPTTVNNSDVQGNEVTAFSQHAQARREADKQSCERLADLMKTEGRIGPHSGITPAVEFQTYADVYPYLIKMAPGEALAISKEKSGLSRSLTVLRNHAGEYELILETKGKLLGHTAAEPKKNAKEEHVRAGSTKQGKPAWRIDGAEVEYFHLVCPVGQEHKYPKGYQIEAQTSQKMTELAGELKDLFTPHELGPLKMTYKQHTGGDLKQSMYAVKAEDSLLQLYPTIKTLPLNEKYRLALELCRAVKVFHDNGYASKDIAARNILVNRAADGKYHFKLTDFGKPRQFYCFNPLGIRHQAEDIRDIVSIFKLIDLDIPYLENKAIPTDLGNWRPIYEYQRTNEDYYYAFSRNRPSITELISVILNLYVPEPVVLSYNTENLRKRAVDVEAEATATTAQIPISKNNEMNLNSGENPHRKKLKLSDK